MFTVLSVGSPGEGLSIAGLGILPHTAPLVDLGWVCFPGVQIIYILSLVPRDQAALARQGSGPRMESVVCVKGALFPLKSSGPNVPDCQCPHFLTNTVQTL